jgi:hypothetical protein
MLRRRNVADALTSHTAFLTATATLEALRDLFGLVDLFGEIQMGLVPASESTSLAVDWSSLAIPNTASRYLASAEVWVAGLRPHFQPNVVLKMISCKSTGMDRAECMLVL